MTNDTSINQIPAVFNTAMEAFLADCQDKINAHYAKNLPNLRPDVLKTMPGKKYIRIVCEGVSSSHRAAWAFIDKSNGDVLKAASWAAPAKHARANIFQPESWVNVTNYGPAYLR